MATVSAGPVDPTKHAEYPILLGDKLAGKASARDTQFVNVNYNHKTKGGSSQQTTVITPGVSDNLYNLTIHDKASDAEQTPLTYKYSGSVDPSSAVSDAEQGSLCLVFDPKRKAFVLEPVSTRLNFNLQSAPGKSDQQVAQQYSQLSTLLDERQSFEEGKSDSGQGLDDEPDESNPFDYRHFLPKHQDSETTKERTKTSSIPALDLDNASSKPELSHATTGKSTAAKQNPKPTSQSNPLRPQKRSPKPAPRSRAEPKGVHMADASHSQSEEEPKQDVEQEQQPAVSPNSNIIVDGDLIIDMGSPPPQRPTFKIDPRHLSSSNTPNNNAGGFGSDEDDELEDPRLPSPAFRRPSPRPQDEEDEGENEDDDDDDDDMEDDSRPPNAGKTEVDVEDDDDDDDDDDDLAAEIKAAFEESAREGQQNRNQEWQRNQSQQQQHILSDDESEVSEEE